MYFSSLNLKIDNILIDSLKVCLIIQFCCILKIKFYFKIYGLIYFEKYEKVINLLTEFKRNNKKVLKFVVSTI